MCGEYIEINTRGLKRGFSSAKNFFSNKKVQTMIIAILILAILITGIWIRTQNLSLLKDQTTGEYIPAALDPFYFLRIAETIAETGGLPDVDPLRAYPQVSFSNEILPFFVVYMWKIASAFDSSLTLQFIDVISPVIFFALGIIFFFFLVYVLTHSKLAALISTLFLAIIPSYIYRTMSGFSDHDSLGITLFLLTMLVFSFSMKFLGKEETKNSKLKAVSLGAAVGLSTALTIAGWGGISTFLFMIIPLSFGLFWMMKSQNLNEEIHSNSESKERFLSYMLFYFTWIILTILISVLIGFGFMETLYRVSLNPASMLTGVFLIFISVDFLLMSNPKTLRKDGLKKNRILTGIIATVLIGIFLLMISGKIGFIGQVFDMLIHPIGVDRVSLTVAENQQPFLNDWIAQTGKIFFWFFFGGLLALGINLTSSIKGNKNKLFFSALWVLFILGILFSRISQESLLNGTSFISKVFYIGSIILFFGYSINLYFKKKMNTGPELLVIFSWAIFTLIAVRSAIRNFFLISPFACFSFGYLISNLMVYRKKNKEDLLKMILPILIVLVIILSFFSFNNLVTASINQGKFTGPSAGPQWQNTMQWVRENTAPGSIFLHWWDYGYWVQYLGERPTLADGGHFQGAFRDHLIGRYVLTTPEPETALSFMKTNNVSYLLIDPTDLGKYGAYSRIGSDESSEDRFSYLPIMSFDQSQSSISNETQTVVYQGGAYVDEDIIYNQNGQEIFLPKNRAIMAAVIIEISNSNGVPSFSGAKGIFIYNNQQISIPLKYVYFNNQLIDFGTGLEATARVLPSASVTAQGIDMNPFGSIIYLSPKVSKSLFAQLYLMNDPLDKYSTLRLVHSHNDPFVQALNQQGANVEFVYYQGFRGPIKIWDTTQIPNNILEREEFLRVTGEYAEFDNLKFTA